MPAVNGYCRMSKWLKERAETNKKKLQTICCCIVSEFSFLFAVLAVYYFVCMRRLFCSLVSGALRRADFVRDLLGLPQLILLNCILPKNICQVACGIFAGHLLTQITQRCVISIFTLIRIPTRRYPESRVHFAPERSLGTSVDRYIFSQ